VPRIAGGLALALLLAGAPPRVSGAEASDPGVAPPTDRFAPLTPPVLADGERQRLEAGGVVVRNLAPSDGGGIAVVVMGLVDAAPEQVWAVMADCGHQAEFLPRVRHAAVFDRDGDEHTCELVVSLPFPLEDSHTRTRNHVRRLPDGGYQRYWELLPGKWSYLRDNGSWTVHPYAEGRRSLLIHRLELLPRSAIPEWIVRAAQVRQAPAAFDAIRARVREGADRAASQAPAPTR